MWGGDGVTFHHWILLNKSLPNYIPNNFCKRKNGCFAIKIEEVGTYSVNLWYIITKLKTDFNSTVRISIKNYLWLHNDNWPMQIALQICFLRKFHENFRFFFILHGANLHFLSRITTSVFAGEIWLKISWGLISFHRRFLRHLYGRVHIFSGGNPKKNQGWIFFVREKKH